MSEEYRDLLNRIQNYYPDMSKGQKLIADYIFDNYDKVAFMTASALGKTVNVSESTVVRFANALGYDGYPVLQKALQESIKTKLTTVQRFGLSEEIAGNERNLLRKVMHSDIDNIRKTSDELDPILMEQVVHQIQTGRRIYILGLRSSKVLAEYLAFYLNFIMDDVHVIPSGASDILDKLVKINHEDVLITISFPRYSRKTFDVVRYAKTQGATLIGITDSMMSPLASLVDYTLTAKYNMTTFIDSLVAPMSLINALIIALSLNEKEKLKSTFDQLERIWEENEVYSKTK